MSKINKVRTKIQKLLFFLLISAAFISATSALAGAQEAAAQNPTSQPRNLKEMKKEIAEEILKSANDLKMAVPATSDEQRKLLEDPELSSFIKEFCPRKNFLSLKVKWQDAVKSYSEKIDLMKKQGPQAVKWKALNLGQNTFVPRESAPFAPSQARGISVPFLASLKAFLDQRLREVYPHCDFKMTRKPQMMSDKIVQDRLLYLRDLSSVNPEQVLDSEMIEMKMYEPVQAADFKNNTLIIFSVYGYKIRFQAPGKTIHRKPIKMVFSVKVLKNGFFLRDMQEVVPSARISIPATEIHRAKMDDYPL